MGAPHSLIRRPGVPGAVFHIMWERLLAGQSMMGYVQNLAKGGAHYLRFSTVTTLTEGFIAVRSTITRPDLWEPVSQPYAQTRALERHWLQEGMSTAEAAARGAEDLVGRFEALGLPTYDDVIRALWLAWKPRPPPQRQSPQRRQLRQRPAYAALSPAVAAHADLSPLAQLLADVRAIVLDPRANLALSVHKGRRVVVRSGVSQKLGVLVDPIDSRLSSGLRELRELDELARGGATSSLTVESDASRDALESLVIPAAQEGGIVMVMKTLIIVLLLVWLLLTLVGALIEGLFWLLVIGLVLLAATAAYGWFKLRRHSDGT